MIKKIKPVLRDYGRRLANMLIVVLRDYAEDFFILLGLIVINAATFRLSTTAGLYCLGVSLITVGVVLARMARQPPGRR